jgi:acyl carrier protein
MTMIAELESFIVNEITPGRGIESIGADDDLLARGIIDSLGVTQLVEFVESRYGIVVSGDDLTPANFQNIGRIEALIERKQQVRA